MKKSTRAQFYFWAERVVYVLIGVGLGTGHTLNALAALIGLLLGTWSRRQERKPRFSFSFTPYEYASREECEENDDHLDSRDADGYCNKCGDK